MMDRKNLAILILSGLIVICIGVTLWALLRGGADAPISPDYPPQGTERNQQPLEDDSTPLESPEGGGAINVTFGTEATAALSAQTVSLYYANPGVSNQNVAFLIRIDELVVAKSDLITPGHAVTELQLEAAACSKLQVGSYAAELVIRAYDPVTGEKAMIDTRGAITLRVVE